MNNLERLMATLQGEPVDRRLFTALFSLYGAGMIDVPLSRYYEDPALFAEGQDAAVEAFQPDILFGPFLMVLYGEIFGSEAKYFEANAPNLHRPAIGSAEEIGSLVPPDIDSHPRLVYLRECQRRLIETHGSDTPVAAIMLSPVDMPIMIMGLDKWMETVLFDEDGVRRMLDITVPVFSELANALFKDGVTTIVLPTAFLTPALASREIVERFASPVLKDVFAQSAGPLVVHHVGSPFLKNLDLFAELPNVVGFVLDSRDDLAAAREIIGPGPLLFSGPEGPTLNKRTHDQIEAQCAGMIEQRQGDSRFVLATTGADIAMDTPRETILALREAVLSEAGDEGC
ncbi:MAG: uroporphyrinogen decarboxylase family protein [Sedimenticola sp.]